MGGLTPRSRPRRSRSTGGARDSASKLSARGKQRLALSRRAFERLWEGFDSAFDKA